MLGYGTQLSRSPINLNQLRVSGTLVKDDPTTDGGQDFGLIADDLFIPFLAASRVYFDSVAPTHDEVEQYMNQVIGPEEWNPSTVKMRNYQQSKQRAIEIAAVAIGNGFPFSALSMNNDAVEIRCDTSEPQAVLSTVSTALDNQTLDRLLLSKLDSQTFVRLLLSKLVTSDKHSPIKAEEVARKYNIGLETAEMTLKVTTQRGIRYATHPLHRRYRTDHLDLHKRILSGTWFMDTLLARHKSLRGNKLLHCISNGKYTRAFPVPDQSSQAAADSLADFIDVGIPQELWSDGAKEYVGRKTPFWKLCNKHRIDLKMTEPSRKNQNHASEREIGELKERWRRRMARKAVSKMLWDYGMVYETELMNRFARGPDGRTGFEMVTGTTPNIIEYCDFEFYDLVWYRPHDKLDEGRLPRELGLWLGPSHRVGSDMSYWILPVSGQVQSHTSVQNVTQEDFATTEYRAAIDVFLVEIKRRLNDENFILRQDPDDTWFYLDDDPDDPAYLMNGDDPDHEGEFPEPVDDEEDAGIDHYLNEVIMETGDGPQCARVIERAKNPDGKKIGSPRRNPMLDTREYFLEFPDQSRRRYSANVIAENLYS